MDLSKHELPDWLKGLDGHKENMTILHGISMCVSGGGHYSYSGCMGAFKAGRNVLSNIKKQRLTSNWPSSSPLHSVMWRCRLLSPMAVRFGPESSQVIRPLRPNSAITAMRTQ